MRSHTDGRTTNPMTKPLSQAQLDNRMNMFGCIAKMLTTEQIYNTLRYHLSKEEMVELGEKLIRKGSQYA